MELYALLAPLLYILVLGGSLATFSSLYRSNKVRKAASLQPWFPANHPRDIYLTLLHGLGSSDGAQEKEKKVPDSIIKTALMLRAKEDIRRLMQLRVAKQPLQMLLQKGSVGDDLWTRFQRAEKEMEEELRDVVMEANTFAPQWGNHIFQSANEMVNAEKLQERVVASMQLAEKERKWWDAQREKSQKELLGEEDGVLVEREGKGKGKAKA